jgi:uncharacterized membrane protein YqjE
MATRTPGPEPGATAAARAAGPGPEPDPELREQSLPDLVKRLAGETSTLVRQEIDLAKAEVSEKGKQAGAAAGILGAAAVTGLLALGALTALLIIVLDLFLPLWLAALIVTLLWAAVAGVLAARGRAKLREAQPPVPEQTVETVKEDVEWAKTQTRSERR